MRIEFIFAGFTWPRYLAHLPVGSPRARLKARASRCTGGYYHAPKPTARDCGFYLASGEGCSFSLRYELTGPEYWCDEDGNQTIQGVIFRLPQSRGFLAGWTMGEHMASSLDYDIFSDEDDAKQCAQSMAENAAENQRQYEYEEREAAMTEEE